MGNALNFDVDLHFVGRCLQEYWGRSRIFLLIALVGLIWTLFCERKRNTLIFWGAVLVLGLTAYNPFLTDRFVPRFVGRAIYYRLFWALPVILFAAYYLTLAVVHTGRRWLQAGTAVLLAAAVLFLCGINTDVTGGFHLPQNIYKVPDALVFACDAIHEDYHSDTGRAPKVVFTEWLQVYSRQYDPSVALTISRDEYLQYFGSPVTEISTDTKHYQRRKRILDVINSRGGVSKKMFRIALRKTKTDYLVIPTEYTCHDYLKKAGCKVVAENEEVIVYYFERKKQSEG